MIDNTLVLPILIPLFSGALLCLWKKTSVLRQITSLIIAMIISTVSIQLVLDVLNTNARKILPFGGWKAPIGIMLNGDILGLTMATLCSLVLIATLLYSIGENQLEEENKLKLPLLFFITAGINLSFLTGDIFNLFVAFEIMLLSSYGLMTLKTQIDTTKFALPYLTINLVGSTLFLCSAGLYYVLFGTLNFASIATEAASLVQDPRLFILAILMIAVFGLKAGFFPLYYWLPSSYPILPAPIGAFFAGLLTKVGIYALIRVFCSLLPLNELQAAYKVILILAGPTMIVGILAAIVAKNIYQILSFNLISHIGFMMFAIGLFQADSLSAGFLYMIHHVIVIASLFLIAGIIVHKTQTTDITQMGGLWKSAPILGILFLIQSLSLTGIPPLSGFWGKIMILKAGLIEESYILVTCVIIASILTLYSMVKIWYSAFYTDTKTTKIHPTYSLSWQYLGVILLVSISLLLGFKVSPFISLSEKGIAMAQNQTELHQTAKNIADYKKTPKETH